MIIVAMLTIGIMNGTNCSRGARRLRQAALRFDFYRDLSSDAANAILRLDKHYFKGGTVISISSCPLRHHIAGWSYRMVLLGTHARLCELLINIPPACPSRTIVIRIGDGWFLGDLTTWLHRLFVILIIA